MQTRTDLRLPEPAQLERYLQRWIMRELSGWLQLAVLELLRDGSVEWCRDVCVGTSPARLLAVRCRDRPGPRRPGFWAARSVAHALAELFEGTVVDVHARPSPLADDARPKRRPPPDGRVQAIDHLWFPNSRGLIHAGERDRWLTSVGMAQFGLPDLELVNVPSHRIELGARLLLGVAQHLIDSCWSPPRDGAHPREVLLTVGELHWALGGNADEEPITHGRGWTRVALELGVDRGGPELLRLRPPMGARSWRDRGAWIRDAYLDLCGPGLE